MAAVTKGTSRPSTSSVRRPVKTTRGYGYLAGNEMYLFPLSERLHQKLYGSTIEDDLNQDLGTETLNVQEEYAKTHYVGPIVAKKTVSKGKTTPNPPPPTSSKNKLPPPPPPTSSRSKTTKAAEPDLSSKAKGKEPISPVKSKEPVSPVKPKASSSTGEGYRLVNAGGKGVATKITVEQILPRYPGELVPDSSVRTSVGKIPDINIRMMPQKHEEPEIIENPELIKPFAIKQENAAILDDPVFIAKFKLTKNKEVGGYTINDLKTFARKLGIQTGNSKEQLISAIDGKFSELGIDYNK